MNTGQFFDLFSTDQNKINKLFQTSLHTGGDFSDLFFQNLQLSYAGLEDGEVNRAYTNLKQGAGIRVIKGIQTGYSYAEDLDQKILEKAASSAREIAGSFGLFQPFQVESKHLNDFYPITDFSFDIKKKVQKLQSLNTRIFSLNPAIKKVNLSISQELSRVLICSSDGKVSHDIRPMVLLSVSVVAEKNNRREQNRVSISLRKNLDYFTDSLLNQLAERLVKQTLTLFEAQAPKGGEMEIVLGAGESGILLHEAIGHGMEADFNRKKISTFTDQINQKVAPDSVTIVDDGTLPFNRGSINTDDENHPGQKTTLVDRGILRSYLFDRLNARYFKTESTGSGRRESFKHHPMPRMRCTYMENGPYEREEIIRSVKKGIFAEDFTNGQVLIGAGDFTFYIKNGYLIENGTLTKPIKDINVIGNGPDILRKITMVGNDLKLSQSGWTCGKDGQGVPVSLGMPTVKVSSITVGGRS